MAAFVAQKGGFKGLLCPGRPCLPERPIRLNGGLELPSGCSTAMAERFVFPFYSSFRDRKSVV